MGPDDLILDGTENASALSELKKSVGDGITLSMDSAGKVSYEENNIYKIFSTL
jgi:hypothetical protein